MLNYAMEGMESGKSGEDPVGRGRNPEWIWRSGKMLLVAAVVADDECHDVVVCLIFPTDESSSRKIETAKGTSSSL